ncbi:MAG: DUF192 domain-containing protein, partial [Patescibacteria group bacterium]|nr:DUF192 domain-containing protein [Patescibacteria group bacterium]MDW8279898.1 DUF192 domain-containing protein [bacterium]
FILGFYFFGFNKLNYKKAIVIINNYKFNVELADNTVKRSKGLSGRSHLKEDEGMLFLFDNYDNYGFWMKDMKFPLDLIWIKDDKIVDISSNVLPEPQKSIFNLTVYYPKESVNKVLEINAGLSDKYGFKIGDRVEFDFNL